MGSKPNLSAKQSVHIGRMINFDDGMMTMTNMGSEIVCVNGPLRRLVDEISRSYSLGVDGS